MNAKVLTKQTDTNLNTRCRLQNIINPKVRKYFTKLCCFFIYHFTCFCNIYPNKFKTNINYDTFKFNLTNRFKLHIVQYTLILLEIINYSLISLCICIIFFYYVFRTIQKLISINNISWTPT